MATVSRPQITNVHEIQSDASPLVCTNCGWYGTEENLAHGNCPECEEEGDIRQNFIPGFMHDETIGEIIGYFASSVVWINANQKPRKYFLNIDVGTNQEFKAVLLKISDVVAQLESDERNKNFIPDETTKLNAEEWNIELVRTWVDKWEAVIKEIEYSAGGAQ